MPSYTVSAPGKVLLAGGYLVLESPNVGLVLAVDRRFYTTVEVLEGEATGRIVVDSPQFAQQWVYQYTAEGVLQSETESKNPFVEKTLAVALAHLLSSTATCPSLQITIHADSDFYSLVPHLQQRNLDRSYESVQSLPPFLPVTRDANGLRKTGLGSSACLVTSLVGALCYALSSSPDRTILYPLAQVCHAHAQGKVGSGFDVSAACHGSHVYIRFPKELAALPERALLSIEDWPEAVQAPLEIPSFLQLLLADVGGGTESPGMARKILAWKEQQSTPVPHWSNLIELNQRLVDLWQQVSHVSLTHNDLDYLAQHPATEWTDYPLLLQLRATFQQTRFHLKAMGEAAGVPVEPSAQTQLADATMALPGVLAALVPGAGGSDALACVFIDVPDVRSRIGQLWATWEACPVCPLTTKAIGGGEGVRLEAAPPVVLR